MQPIHREILQTLAARWAAAWLYTQHRPSIRQPQFVVGDQLHRKKARIHARSAVCGSAAAPLLPKRELRSSGRRPDLVRNYTVISTNMSSAEFAAWRCSAALATDLRAPSSSPP